MVIVVIVNVANMKSRLRLSKIQNADQVVQSWNKSTATINLQNSLWLKTVKHNSFDYNLHYSVSHKANVYIFYNGCYVYSYLIV